MAPQHMRDALRLSEDQLPLSALIEAIEASEAANNWSMLEAAHNKALAALRSRREDFDILYERAVAPDASWDEIARVASMIGEWGPTAAEKFHPQIDALQRKLDARYGGISRKLRHAPQQSIEVAETWLSLYREFHEKLQRLAVERRPADVVLRARPAEGEIDYGELSREHIKRYPKIRAALAK
jgi:hypothetical protein